MKYLILLLSFISFSLSSYGQSNQNDTIISNDSTEVKKSPIFVFDNEIISNVELKKIDVNEIAEISVLKPEMRFAFNPTGEIGKYGIVIVKSYDYKAKEWFEFFNEMAKSNELEWIINSIDFDYKEYKVILNDNYLKTNFFIGTNLKKEEIIEVKFERIFDENSEYKGFIYVKTKQDN